MESGDQHICRVGVKVPPFWPQQPEVWFAQLEAQFNLAGVRDDRTKFNYVVASLEANYASEIIDIINAPPEMDAYQLIKDQLIQRLSVSENKRLQQHLMHEEIGDRKPSQFLRHLQRLAGSKVPEELLTTIWLSRLPSPIQAILVSRPKFFGIICMATASPARLSATSWFLFVAVTSFISTLIWIFIYLLSIRESLKLPINWTFTELLNTLIKTVLYVTAFISQLSAWSSIHHASPPRDPNLTAGSFGLFNSIAYAAGVYYLYKDWKYTQSSSGP